MWRSQARITPPPLVPLLTTKKQDLGAASIHLNLWTKPQRPPCIFPNLTAPFQESQHFCPFPGLDPPRTTPCTSEGADWGQPQAKAKLQRLPGPLSPSSHLRPMLGVRRNPSWPSSWENDLQGWGPQASVQAIPINIKQ